MNNEFKTNSNQKKRLFVVDDFYTNPLAIREHALAQTYFQGEGAVGERTREQFLFDGLKEKFEEIMQIKISDFNDDGFGWYNVGINGRFQSCIGGVPQVFHCDSQQWAGVIFLTPDAPIQSGTSFYRNKKSKVYHNSQIDWSVGENGNAFSKETFLDPTPFEKQDSIGNVFNRLVIFDGGLIHSGNDYFGHNLETSRLFQIFFFNEENNSNKLNGLKSVNCISLESSKERQIKTINEFNKFGVTTKIVSAYDGRIVDYKNNPMVQGWFLNQMDSGSIATILSHLKAIKDWYNNTNEDYGFFCEDDLLISNANNWSFNWNNLIDNLPKDWKAIQLSLIKELNNENSYIKETDIKLKIRKWNNWSCSSYIITRSYAKELLDKYYPNEVFILINNELIPMVENIIYGCENEHIYSLPVFIEDISFKSTFYPQFIDNEHKNHQKESANFLINWWKKYGKTTTIENLCKA